MLSLPDHRRLSAEEYLLIERQAAYKTAFIDGVMYGMAGASWRHGLLVGNLVAAIHTQLRDGPCVVQPQDLRVRSRSKKGMYVYPDLTVVCGEPKWADHHQDTLLNPAVIIEVLSPSTESLDRGAKFAQYREITSLKAYVLVSQDRMEVEVHERQGEQWVLTATLREPEETLRLETIGCQIPLAEMYRRVTWEEDE